MGAPAKNEEKDGLRGVSDGIDTILSQGSLLAYKKGVVLGYFANENFSSTEPSSKSVRGQIKKIENSSKDAFSVLFQKKNQMDW